MSMTAVELAIQPTWDEEAAQEELLTRKTALETEDLSVYYGEKAAVKNVNLYLKERTVTAFIGPSGCGKSTFLRSLNRMNDTIAAARVTGKILIDGVDINDDKISAVNVRRNIGMVFQKPNPFHKSIYNNIAYGPRMYGAAKKELDDIVERSLQRVGQFRWDWAAASIWRNTPSPIN